MILNVLFSTIDSGINRINNILLPFRPDVRYIVSHQFRNRKFIDNPLCSRKDVEVSHIPGAGLTKSRNNAISLAQEGISIIADDDVRYTNDYFDKVLKTFHDHNPDVALFKIKSLPGEKEYRGYPNISYRLSEGKMHIPSSIEIAFRVSSIKNNTLKFDERFGLGSYISFGEEYIFIHDCVRKGLHVQYFPKYIVEHPFQSTIKSFPKYDKKLILVDGATDARLHGYKSIIKSFATTWKFLPDIIQKGRNPLVYLGNRLSGAFYILSTKTM